MELSDAFTRFFGPPALAPRNGTYHAWAERGGPMDGVGLEDFYSLATENKSIFAPSGDLWPNSSVNARIGPVPTGRKTKSGADEYESAYSYLAQHRSVEQLSWVPGEPQVIEDTLFSNGGRIYKKGCQVFNLYRPPTITLGDSKKAKLWLDLGEHLYADWFPYILAWLAHKVQRPGVKINHALVLGGPPGIGKDTLIEPHRYAVGEANFEDVTPSQLRGRFNSFVKSVVLRVSEARDLGDVDRLGFYEYLKIYTAAPPEMLRCDEKNVREYYVPNVTGIIMTTNHKTGGIYLPANDRRHFVAWSESVPKDFDESYWLHLWDWYKREGFEHVAACLHEYNLSGFDPKAPPPKTQAFWEIVDSNRAPEDAELADALDTIASEAGRDELPAVVTLTMLSKASTSSDFSEWLKDRRNRRQIPHRFETAGYVPVRNRDAQDGLWKVDGKRQAIYARKTDSLRNRIENVQKLCRDALSVPF
ncbi:MAG: hypothetical protein KJO98_16585 [Rhodothermia bacterium]|nr:hypothetical protein [Rhodothermia bacterium]